MRVLPIQLIVFWVLSKVFKVPIVNHFSEKITFSPCKLLKKRFRSTLKHASILKKKYWPWIKPWITEINVTKITIHREKIRQPPENHDYPLFQFLFTGTIKALQEYSTSIHGGWKTTISRIKFIANKHPRLTWKLAQKKNLVDSRKLCVSHFLALLSSTFSSTFIEHLFEYLLLNPVKTTQQPKFNSVSCWLCQFFSFLTWLYFRYIFI